MPLVLDLDPAYFRAFMQKVLGICNDFCIFQVDDMLLHISTD